MWLQNELFGQKRDVDHFAFLGSNCGLVIDMVVVEPNVYDAVFPPFACSTAIEYWFTAESTEGEVAVEPTPAVSGDVTNAEGLSPDDPADPCPGRFGR